MSASPTRHFSYATAAIEFELPERWLRTHIKDLPHHRFGRYVRFSHTDMLAISAQYAHVVQAELVPVNVSAVSDLRPSPARRRMKAA